MSSSTTTYRSAAPAFADLVERIPADAWARPALGVWDVKALVGHTGRALSTVSSYLQQPAEVQRMGSAAQYYAAAKLHAAPAAQDAVAERGRQAGADFGPDPAEAIRGLVREVLRELDAEPGDPLITTIAGGMRLSDYLPTRTYELAEHGFDIATAAGIEFAPPDDVLSETTRLAVDVSRLLGDGALVLKALTGRATLPDGFSVV